MNIFIPEWIVIGFISTLALVAIAACWYWLGYYVFHKCKERGWEARMLWYVVMSLKRDDEFLYDSHKYFIRKMREEGREELLERMENSYKYK